VTNSPSTSSGTGEEDERSRRTTLPEHVSDGRAMTAVQTFQRTIPSARSLFVGVAAARSRPKRLRLLCCALPRGDFLAGLLGNMTHKATNKNRGAEVLGANAPHSQLVSEHAKDPHSHRSGGLFNSTFGANEPGGGKLMNQNIETITFCPRDSSKRGNRARDRRKIRDPSRQLVRGRPGIPRTDLLVEQEL
jgi:hypothetical protein